MEYHRYHSQISNLEILLFPVVIHVHIHYFIYIYAMNNVLRLVKLVNEDLHFFPFADVCLHGFMIEPFEGILHLAADFPIHLD